MSNEDFERHRRVLESELTRGGDAARRAYRPVLGRDRPGAIRVRLAGALPRGGPLDNARGALGGLARCGDRSGVGPRNRGRRVDPAATGRRPVAAGHPADCRPRRLQARNELLRRTLSEQAQRVPGFGEPCPSRPGRHRTRTSPHHNRNWYSPGDSCQSRLGRPPAILRDRDQRGPRRTRAPSATRSTGRDEVEGLPELVEAFGERCAHRAQAQRRDACIAAERGCARGPHPAAR